MKFSVSAAFKTFVGRKAERGIGAFLDKAGLENVCKAIETGVLVTDQMPMEPKLLWKMQLEPYKDFIPAFTDQDLYNWIPQRYRSVFEQKYGPVYTQYMARQCRAIRDFLSY